MARYTERLFVATAFLAGVTFALVVAAFFQMRDSRKGIAASELAAKAAVRSANISEKALIELHAPFVYVLITRPGISIEKTPVAAGQGPSDVSRWKYTTEFGFGRFMFRNYGRTPARISSYFWDVKVVDTGAMPESINIALANERLMPDGIFVLADGGGSSEYEYDFDAIREAINLNVARQSMFFLVFIRYRDIFGERYRSGFCFVFDYQSNNFVLKGDKAYNYRSREEEPQKIPT